MKPLIRYILLSSSLVLLIPKRTAKACGFYVWPGEYRFWLLQPDLTNEPDLTPFYFATTYLYKDDINAARDIYKDENIEDWFAIAKGKATRKDINELLYHTDASVFFVHLKRLSLENSLMRFLVLPGNKDLYNYFLISKKVEQIASHPDPWGEDHFPSSSIGAVITDAKQLYSSTKNPFVKLRAAYQLVRLYRYNAQNDLLIAAYDGSIEPIDTRSWVKSAALYQKALSSDGSTYNYLLSKVFDRGNYNRTYCLTGFETQQYESTLKLAKNAHEKVVIRAMKTFQFPGRSLAEIKSIYDQDPIYKEIPFLLLREINKVEDWLVTMKVTSFESPAVHSNQYLDWPDYDKSNYKEDQDYAHELYLFIEKIIKENKNSEPALLHTYAAHLALLNESDSACVHHLHLALQTKNISQNLRTQIQIISYLLKLEKGFDQSTENAFMRIIKSSDKSLGLYDPEIMKNQLILYTAKKLIKHGNKSRGLLLLSKTNRAIGELLIGDYKGIYQEIEEQADEKDYDEMLALFKKTNRSPFEQFISETRIHTPYIWWADSLQRFRVSKLLDCKSSWYIRHYQLEKALEVLQQIPNEFWKESPYKEYIGGNPFYLNINLAHRITKEDHLTLNKRQVIEEMIRLEKLADTDKSKAADCYYQLGNAWYNMSYFGKNWLMVKQWWSINEPDVKRGLANNPAFLRHYYGCEKAKEYYDKAIRATRDKKLAALCFFMSRECQDNFLQYLGEVSNREIPSADLAQNIALAKKKGIDPNYYRQIVNECETYQSFIGQYNKRF